MALGDLTSKDAVLMALAEYDRLGESAFLKKYGFRSAQSYFLVHLGKRYASKAVVVAAHGYQHGTSLKAAEFGGGDSTVKARLEELGFSVEVMNHDEPTLAALGLDRKTVELISVDRLHELGGQGKVSDVYQAIEDHINGPLPDRPRPTIREVLVRSHKRSGYIEHLDGADDGWRLTEKGTSLAERRAAGQPTSKRNPPWRREELILALDYYLSHHLPEHTASSPGIIELSETLNKLPFHQDRPDTDRFRNPNGCEMKLCNFRAFDPNYDGKGLDAGSKLDKAIWDEFYNDQEWLHREAETIRALVKNPEALAEVSHPEEGEEGHQEGALKYRLHRARERSSKVVEQAKKAWGKDPRCEVCNTSFGETYPSIGEGFIEAHHRVPLAELGAENVTKPSDLAAVCANCHRMLHWKAGTSINLLRELTNSSQRK